MVKRVFEYGALPPIRGIEVARGQMYLGYELRDELVRQRRSHDQDIDKLYQQFMTEEGTALQLQIDGLYKQRREIVKNIGRVRSDTFMKANALGISWEQTNREATENNSENVKHLEENKTQVKALWKKYRVLKRAVQAEHKAELDAGKTMIDSHYKQASKIKKIRPVLDARRESVESRLGLPPNLHARNIHDGTYNPVKVNAAGATKFKTFHECSTDGLIVGLQIQKAFRTEDVWTESTSERGTYCRRLLSIDELPPATRQDGRRTRRERRTFLRVDIARRGLPESGPDGKPLPPQPQNQQHSVVIPILMHRPLPPGEIERVDIVEKRVANRHVWTVRITVELDLPEATQLRKDDRVAGVDLGWRKENDDGLLMATVSSATPFSQDQRSEFAGSDGVLFDAVRFLDDRTVQLRIPNTIVRKAAHADSIRGAIDDNLNVIIATIRAWRDANPDLVTLLPEATKKSLKTAHLWRSVGKVVVFARDLASSAVHALDLQTALEVWRRRNLHLEQYHTHSKNSARAHRNDVLRKFARALVRNFGEIRFEGEINDKGEVQAMDLTTFKRAPSQEKAPSTVGKKTRKQASLATPGFFRLYVMEAAAGSGTKIAYVDKKRTSKTCHDCKHVNEIGSTVYVTCANCGSEWHRDANAAKNIASASVLGYDAETLAANNPATTRQKGAYAVRREKKKAKEAEGARNDEENTFKNAAE